MSSLIKMVEKERREFFNGNHRYHFRHSGVGHNINEIYRLYHCLNIENRIQAEDRGEIVKHWLEHDEFFDHYPKKPLKTLDDARESVMRIDDGRIGADTWWPERSRHPVWHTPIGK